MVLAVAALAPARALDAPSATVTITVQPGARQTFVEFGASLLNFNGDYQKLTRPQARSLSRIFWGGLRFNTLRRWSSSDQYAPVPGAHDLRQFRTCYVDSHIVADAQANGVTTLLLAPNHLPAYLAERRPHGSSQNGGNALQRGAEGDYAALLAEFID